MLRKAAQANAPRRTGDLRGRLLRSEWTLDELANMTDLGVGHRRIARGEALFQAGDRFRSVYAVRSGFFKSYVFTEDGRSQITGFQMSGDVLGMDGIDSETHAQSAVAVDESDVWIFPRAKLDLAAAPADTFPQLLRRAMSRELVRAHDMMILLGTMDAEERVAAFLVDLSQRHAGLGYSGDEFTLHMTREDVASYLGLKLETVSRMLSRFRENGLIGARNRDVRILDRPGLYAVVGRNVPE